MAGVAATTMPSLVAPSPPVLRPRSTAGRHPVSARRATPLPGPHHHASSPSHRVQLPSQRRGVATVVRSAAPKASSSSSSSYNRDLSSAPRLIQHKNEAFWFYRYLSIVYDHIVNPGHWTEDMREDALSVAKLERPNLQVVDVGGGTGFTTLGIVKHVAASNVTLLDQSPHQLAKAKAKAPLRDVTIVEGDAEDLPFQTDQFDRYVSAGSIEYWPDPQRGVAEAYRVVKPGGTACIIGPVHPTWPISRFFADVWMLFPKESEYIEWFTKAGFEDVKIHRIGPKWYRGVRRHGLIMGCSVTGTKPRAGPSPLELPPIGEVSKQSNTNPLAFLLRFFLGTAAGFYYFLVPVYMWIKNLIWPRWLPGF